MATDAVDDHAADAWLEDVELRARWRDAIRAVTTAMLTEDDPEEFLHTVAEAANDLMEGDVATIAVPWVSGQSLRLRIAVGYRAEDLKGSVFPVEESLSGAVLASGRGTRVKDATRHRNAYQPICELGDMGPTAIAPLVARKTPFGTLLVARRRGSELFTGTQLSALESFSDHAALATELGDLRERLGRLAVVEERERMARELHDSVVQNLFALGLEVQATAAQHPDAAARLHQVVDHLDRVIKVIRTRVLELDPDADPPG